PTVYTIADLPQGATETIVLTYTIDATFQGETLNNAAEITEDDGDDSDSDPEEGPDTDEDGDGDGDDDDEDNEDIDVEQDYDLSLEKDVTSAGPYQQGSTVEYTLTITNEGSLNAANIEVTDTPQAGLNFVSSDADGVDIVQVSPTVYTISSLLQGETKTIVLTYTIDPTFQGETLNNAAEITEDDGDDSDSDPEEGPDTDEDGDGDGDDDDEDNEDIDVEQDYDLALEKDVTSAGPYQQGSTVEYTLTVTNEGSLNAANIEVTDTPQAGLNFVSSDADGAQVIQVSPTVYTIADLPQGATETIVLTYTIDATFQGETLNNAAEITEDDGDDSDSDPEEGPDTDEDGDGDGDDDDEDNEDIDVEQDYDLALEKDVTSAGPYQQGSTVEYTLTIINEGSLNAANIEVTDTPQAGLNFVSSDADGAQVIQVSPTVYTIADLPQGATETIVLTYTIDATFQDETLNNAAEITEDDGDDSDSDPEEGPDTDEDGDGDGDDDDEDNEDINVEQDYDLSLEKDVTSAGPYQQGSTVEYTLTIINEGSLNAANIEVTDTPQAGLNFVSSDADGAQVIQVSATVYTIADLPQGATETIVLTYTIDATFQGETLNNAAEITEDDGDDSDSDPEEGPDTDEDGDGDGDDDDEDNEDINVEQDYDLSLEKDVTSAGPYQQGSTVEYTLTITNEGSLNAANIEVTDTPQAGLNFVSSDADGAQVIQVSPTVYTIADLPQGATETIVLTYTIDATFQGETLNNAAEITEDDGDDSDSDPEEGPDTDEDGDGDGDDDDEDNEDIDVEQDYDLALEKDVTSAGPYQQGSTVEYTLTVTNEGSLNAANIEVTDTPQAGLNFVSSDADGFDIVQVSPTVYTISSLLQGETKTIVLTYTIDPTFQGETLNNAAEITEDDGDDSDSDPEMGPEEDEDGDGDGDDDDEDNEDIEVVQDYDLALEKDVTSAGPYQQGSTVEYTLTITNEGSLNAANIEVTDTPQAGLNFVSSDADGAQVIQVSPTVYTIADLPQGATETIVLTYTIDATFQGETLNNAAEITEDDGDDSDSDPEMGPEEDEDGDGDGDDDDEDNEDIEVEQEFDLAIDKNLAPGQAPITLSGANVNYTITVTNEGSINAVDVEVMDDAPTGLNYQSADVSGTNVIANGNGSFTIPSLLQGESVTFEITYMTDEGVAIGQVLTNQIEITEDNNDDVDSDADDSFDEDDLNDGIEDDDEDDVSITNLGINVEKVVDNAEICAGDTVTYTLTVRFRDNICVEGSELRNISVMDMDGEGFELMLMPGGDFFIASSDPNGDGMLQCDEEFMWQYKRVLEEDNQNIAMDMAEVWFVFPDGSDAFVGNAMFADTANVIVNPAVELTVVDADVDGSISCNGFDDGSAVATVTVGEAPFTYEWSDGTPQGDGSTVTGLSANVWYFVTVTDNNGCIGVDSVLLDEPTLLLATATATDVDCNGEATGTATVVAMGGTPDYTYLWDDAAAQTMATATGLVAGTYSVTVTDANGCTEVATATVEEASDLTASVEDAVVLCFGDDDGELTVVAMGGTPDYTYEWDAAAGGQTTATATGLVAGTYSVTVTDANGCEEITTGTITEPTDLTASLEDAVVLCFGDDDGELTVVAMGGTPDYTYEWDAAAGGQTTATATGLTAGTYSVTVTDANGCEEIATGTITEPTDLTASVEDAVVLCFGDDDGELTVVAMGGTPDYTYEWDAAAGGQMTATATGLTAGTYSVTVTDANGCEEITTGTITEPTDLTATTTTTDVGCNGEATGTATVVAMGGTPDYTYLWDDAAAQTMATATGLVAGTYSVTVTDANGCTEVATATVEEASDLTASVEDAVVLCFGDDDGELTVVAMGGTPDYTYEWDAAAGGQTTATATGLVAGTYSVTVTDANGCEEITTGTITEPTDLTASVEDAVVLCFGDDDGELTVVAMGGTPDYTYEWDAAAGGQTTATATGLTAGTYSVTVTDANGCEEIATGTITEPTDLTASVEDAVVLCFGDDDGELTVVAMGGTPDYTYEWDAAAGGQMTATATGLTAGTYSVTVTDANGCEEITTGTITEPTDLTATTTTTDVGCNGEATGTATVVAMGGTPDYTYLWDDAAAQTMATATDLVAGTYSVTVTDANGCTEVATATVEEASDLTASVEDAVVLCFGDDDGELTVVAMGGTPDYTYEWDAAAGGQTTATATGLVAGTYSVTVTDANGCEEIATGTITEPTDLTASVEDAVVLCFGDDDGELTVVAMGGTPDYTYEWDVAAGGQTTATATGLVAGTYSVTVTDANGCEEIATGTITEPTDLTATIEDAVVLCFGDDDGELTVVAMGGTPDYTYEWDAAAGGQTTATATGLVAGTYSVTVTDANGCEEITTGTITEPTDLTATTTTTDVGCNGEATGTATVVAMGGTPDYTYLWDDAAAQTMATATGLVAGTYSVTVTDANGCTEVATATVEEASELEIGVDPVITDVTCLGGSDGSIMITVTGGTGDYTYLWSNDSTTANLIDITAGTYNVTVTDEAGCDVVGGPYTVEDGETFTVEVENDSICAISGALGELTAVITDGGSGDFSYEWSEGTLTATAEDLDPGVYTVTVTDNVTGCMVIATGEVVDDVNQCVQLGDFVWSDLDTDGIQDDGEPGIPGVTVNLLDGDGNVIATTTTGPDGMYLFSDLNPEAVYQVEFIAPDGYLPSPQFAGNDDEIDSNADPVTGLSEQVTLDMGDDLTIDAGFIPLGSIGNFVWEDLDEDGQQDDGEPGIFGVVVNLLDGDGNFIATTTTDVDGFYLFPGLNAGNYIVEFELPDGSIFTDANMGDDETDSDADPISGQSGIIMLDQGEDDLTIDAGIILTPCEIEVILIAGPDCDDNGTPTDPSDDTFTVTVEIIHSNTSGNWVANNGATGTFDEDGVTVATLTYPANNDPNPSDIVLAIADADDADCFGTVSFTPIGECSDACSISASASGSPVCNDNGTPVDPEDDFLEIGIVVVDVNDASGNWTATVANDVPAEGTVLGNGGYGGQTVVLTNITTDMFYSIPLQNGLYIDILVTDDGDAGCTSLVTVEVPEEFPCSDQCQINMELVTTYCNANGTIFDDTDDVWYAQVEVSIANTQGWTAPEYGYFGSNPAGVYQFGPFQAGENPTISITAWDDVGFCNAEITVEPPVDFPCSDYCLVEADFGTPFCDDNGTPADSLDDVFYLNITAFEASTNNGGSWLLFADGDQFSGPHPWNQTILAGPFNIFDENGVRNETIDIRVRDISSLYCRVDSTFSVPDPCSFETPVCNLSVDDVTIVCNDDDQENGYFVTVTVTNGGANGTYTLTGNGINVQGTYGQPLDLPELPDANGEIFTFSVVDDADPTCGTTFEVEEPLTCVPDCQLEAEILAVVCDDNGTPFDGDDDTYTVEVLITGQNGDYTVDYFSPVDYSDDNGTFDNVEVFGPFPADENVNAIITSDANPDCQLALFVQGTGPCNDCQITTENLTIVCNDEGTPDDFDDDTFTVTVDVNGFGSASPGAMYVFTDADGNDVLTSSGMYPFTIEETFPISGGDLTLMIMDFNTTDNPDCMVELFIEAPEAGCGAMPCEITATLLATGICDDNGTPLDGSDDTFTFTVEVTGTETGDGFTTSVTGNEVFDYDEEVTIMVPTGNGEDLLVIITDVDSEDCIAVVPVENPGSCERECVIDEITLVEDGLGNCDDNGTPLDPSDDVFTFTINVTGTDVDNGYTTSVTGDQVFPYGVDTTITVPVGDGSNIVVVVTDALDEGCTNEVAVLNPGTCELVCFIEAEITFVGECDQAGSPADSTDDFYEIIVFVEGDDNAASWNSIYGSGAYDTPVTLQVPILGDTVFTIVDGFDPNCTTEVTILGAPDPCDTPGPMVECPTSNHYCPIIEENIMLFPVDYFDCVATFDVPTPDVTGTCSDTFELITQIVDANGDTIITILDGEDREVILGLGDYDIVYTITDSCGGTASQVCIIRVADLQEPAAICISDINVSVGGYGIARVYNNVIDLGSYDNCSIDSILVRRFISVDSNGIVTWSEWGEFVDMDCADVGTTVTVQLRVVDGSGNENICETSISVVDNTLPYCTGLLDIEIGCTDLPNFFDPTDSLTLVELFGEPEVIDNCAAEAIELPAIFVGDECSGAGVITRRFLAIDEFGNVSAQEFTQTIIIEATQGFTLVFPTDTVTNCLDEDQGFDIIGGGCAQLSVSFNDSIVEPLEDEREGCLYVERTYLVINECAYDGVTPPMQIRRDEDCDGIGGEDVTYVIVDGNLSYVDLDTTFTNNFPIAGTKGTDCDGTTNPTGYLRAGATVNAWTYTQRLILIDTTPPVMIFEDPEPYCTTDGNECEGEISVDITIEGECTAAGGAFLIMVDLFSDGSPEFALNNDDNVMGEFPNFTITNTMLPIGEHTLMIRYVDGCNNSSSIMVPVSVVDCSLPEMTCYSGLIVELEENDTDVNGDDIIDQGITVVEAGQLASCFITDCSGDLSFSVNRVGEIANRDSTAITLTCDDRFMVELEVYMWDNAFNPFAIQPDSTIGGPNWTFCTVEVFVQDPNGFCPDCVTPGLINLDGAVATPAGIAISPTEVELSGTTSSEQVTNGNGFYRFEALVSGDYTIQPYKNDDVENGISTLDAYILQRHLLGIEELSTPYQLIAADVNNSGSITTLDLLLLRNLILGNISEFPNNTSWRFFDATQSMEGMDNVLQEELFEMVVLEDITSCTNNIDFIGVKIGDLNGSVTANPEDNGIIIDQGGEAGASPSARNERESFPLHLNDEWLTAGEAVELPVTATDLDLLIGAQFTLELATDLVKITDVTPGLMTANQIGTQRIERGLISASWNLSGAAATNDEQVLFTVTVVPNRDVITSEVISLTDAPTRTEAYAVANEIIDLHLHFTSVAQVSSGSPLVASAAQSLEMELMPNYPNPFIEKTTIRFFLPEASITTLTIFDPNGRIVKTIEQDLTAGHHSVQLDGDDIPRGSLIYTLEAGDNRKTRTMTRLR
ncbi:hypothetical protein CEQ90_18035, partial [Lewinellaceae bacterium SD302]